MTLLILFIASLNAEPLLTNHPSLQDANLTLLGAKVEAGKVWLTPPKDKNLDKQDLFLLGSDGKFHELDGNLQAANEKHEVCGLQEPVTTLRFKDQHPVNGGLIAVGSNPEKTLRWQATKPTANLATQKCEARKGFTLKQTNAYKIQGMTVRLAIRKFENKRSPLSCNPQMAEELVVIDSNGACHPIHWAIQDCDHEESSLWHEDILGVLVVSGKDKWLVIKTTNSRSNGLTAYPFDGKKINESRRQLAHPPGC